MIQFDRVCFRYADSTNEVLSELNFTIPEGELCLVVGATGSGKSTLLQLVNGLAPHFTGGQLTGTVTVDGRNTRTNRPRDLAEVIGVVGQDPVLGFVTDRVEDELAYSMEQLGIPAPVMRQRVEQVIDLLSLDQLRHRSLSTLSAGQQQRVAIGAALTAEPRVLVLDEPTSALDPSAAEDVLAALHRLVHDLGVTVLLAEHRLERVIQYADSVLMLDGSGGAQYGPPASVLGRTRLDVPILELGHLANWEPLPLSIRDARRVAGPLRAKLSRRIRSVSESPTGQNQVAAEPTAPLPLALRAENLSVHYDRVVAVNQVSLGLHSGEVAALMGRNGAGKSSLLWALHGVGPKSGGTVAVTNSKPAGLKSPDSPRHVVLVPQHPSDLLYLDSVQRECDEADAVAGVEPNTARSIFERLSPGIDPAAHPRDLSEGQRLALVLALQLSGQPAVILLDEPTRGLDYSAKKRLSAVLAEQAERGAAVLLSSHDVEFVARTAARVIVLADGQVITDGAAHDVLTASATFAPQVARILRPLAILTVDEVRRALEAAQ